MKWLPVIGFWIVVLVAVFLLVVFGVSFLREDVDGKSTISTGK